MFLDLHDEDNEIDIVNDFRETIRSMVEAGRERLPKSREASLALTKLEEAALWLGEVREGR